MAYLLSTSGFHIQLLVAALLTPLRFLVGRRVKSLLVLVISFGFAAMVGWPAAAVRTALTLTLQSYARWWWLVLVSAALMLLVHRQFITDVGFQLSVLAGFGTNLIGKSLRQCGQAFLPHSKSGAPQWLTRVSRYVLTSVASSIGALALSWPLIIYHFHEISLLSVFSSLVLMWQVPFIVISSYVAIILTQVSKFFGLQSSIILTIWGKVLDLEVEFLLREIAWLAQNTWALLEVSSMPLVIVVMWCLVMVWFLRKRLI